MPQPTQPAGGRVPALTLQNVPEEGPFDRIRLGGQDSAYAFENFELASDDFAHLSLNASNQNLLNTQMQSNSPQANSPHFYPGSVSSNSTQDVPMDEDPQNNLPPQNLLNNRFVNQEND